MAAKFDLVRRFIAAAPPRERAPPALLDVGCRGCELRRYVADLVAYTGVDLVQNAAGTVDVVVDVDRGLPFRDRSFDYVVALDLVEHLDGFHQGMKELARLTRGGLIVVVPNMAHAYARLRFLLDGRFSFTRKYDLELGPVVDRHRWVTVLSQTDRYMCWFAAQAGLRLRIEYLSPGRWRTAAGRIGRLLHLPPVLWAWKVAYLFERP